jgi:hypothetical protein
MLYEFATLKTNFNKAIVSGSRLFFDFTILFIMDIQLLFEKPDVF